MNKPSLFPAAFSRRAVLAATAAVSAIGLLGTAPVHEGLRDFLFHRWVEVMAQAAVVHGAQLAGQLAAGGGALAGGEGGHAADHGRRAVGNSPNGNLAGQRLPDYAR